MELKRAPEPVAEVPPVAPEPAAASVALAEEPQASAGATAPGSVISGEVLFDFDRFELTAQARAKLDSLGDGACRDMGRESRFNRRLVECLQPDRRVGVEASGSRPQVSSR